MAVETAQGDWTKGATSAWANYLDSSQNVAGQTKRLFGNAFSLMEDSIVNFTMTGKLSSADLTKSILADMARIATRQAASGLLGSLGGRSFFLLVYPAINHQYDLGACHAISYTWSRS